MKISIVILNWNDRSHLLECLDSLKDCSTSREVEIIVVDNGSTDGSAEAVERNYSYVKVLKNKENVGFPKGNNQGIRASTGEYIYVLNSDIKVLGKCVDILADYLDNHPDIGMIGPKIYYGDMTHQSSCRRFPTIWNNFCSAFGLTKVFAKSKLFSGEHMFYFKGDKTIDVDVLVGCFWTVRRTALDRFGLLDEGFFIYAEDVDWCKRCWKSGWRIVFYPEAEAIHYGGASTTAKDPVRFSVTQQRSILRYWKKHHGSMKCLAIGAILFGRMAIRLTTSIAVSMINPKRRMAKAETIKVSVACLKALFTTKVVV